jgi:hypothetical protein
VPVSLGDNRPAPGIRDDLDLQNAHVPTVRLRIVGERLRWTPQRS